MRIVLPSLLPLLLLVLLLVEGFGRLVALETRCGGGSGCVRAGCGCRTRACIPWACGCEEWEGFCGEEGFKGLVAMGCSGLVASCGSRAS